MQTEVTADADGCTIRLNRVFFPFESFFINSFLLFY